MSNDRFTEVTETGWGGRTKSSLKGIFFGIILFVGAFPLLFWNEGRAVKRYKTLQEGAASVVSIAPDRVDPQNEGRLVHTSGRAETRETLADADFAVSQQALRLRRTVKMYQWKENQETRTTKKTGGSERRETTYSYAKAWSASLIQSSGFKHRSGHENPTVMPFAARTLDAAHVTLGNFTLPPDLVSRIDNWVKVPVDPSTPLPASLGHQGKVHDGDYYRGSNPDDPAIGDLRISFEAVYPGPISLVAAQRGDSFSTYTTKTGGTIDLLQTGSLTAAQMFTTAHFHNRLLTWGIRIGGFLLMAIGIAIILKPLSVFADVIPLIGSLVGLGTGIVSLVLAFFAWLMVIGVAWVFHRPVLGLSLMILAVALGGWVVAKRRKKPKASAGPPSPPSSVHPAPPVPGPPPPPQ